jgi:peptide/nickel transport system substrate-binding protein
VEAPDRYTVRLHLKRPDPLFNGSMVTTLSASILCRKAFEERCAEAFNMDPIGTGPYQVDSVSPTQGVMLSPFAQHFEGVAASPLRIAFIADTTARTLAFASGQVDMIEGVRQPG